MAGGWRSNAMVERYASSTATERFACRAEEAQPRRRPLVPRLSARASSQASLADRSELLM
jgi:hypothetical protein